MTERWAPIHRTNPWPQCTYCGDAREQGRPHEAVTCMLCGVTQCKRRNTCAICFVGYLPGWSRKTESWQLGIQLRHCSYKGCDAEAVAMVTRSRAACLVHCEQAKRQGKSVAGLARAAAARLTEANGRDVRWFNDNWRLVA